MTYTFVCHLRKQLGDPWEELCRVASKSKQIAFEECLIAGNFHYNEGIKRGLFYATKASVVVLRYPEMPYDFCWEKRTPRKRRRK